MNPRLLLVAAATFALAQPDEPAAEPALVVRFEKPAILFERVIGLFRGSLAADPATALANWKRATKGQTSLGKGTEAAITVFNPAMVGELKTLDEAGLVVDFSVDGALHWSFAVPKDDGTFAAFTTALALTDGQAEPPLGAMSVDRLGKPGSSLMGREGDLVVVADSRAAMIVGRDAIRRRNFAVDLGGSVQGRFRASGMARSSRLDARRCGAALSGLGFTQGIFAAAVTEHQAWLIVRRFRPSADGAVHLEPDWFADVPAGVSLTFSIAIDARPAAWDRIFDAVDRVEKADPANAGRSPVRTRMGLLARVAGLDLETDLWPNLRGVTAFVIGPATEPRGVALALHVANDATARMLRDRFLPRLARSLRLDPAAGPLAKRSARALADVRGQTVWVSTDAERTVWVGWGEEAVPARVVGVRRARLFDGSSKAWSDEMRTFGRRGWIWPSRLGLAPRGSPLEAALAASEPLRWEGTNKVDEATDSFFWDHPERTVSRFLELIPQQPAPAPPK